MCAQPLKRKLAAVLHTDVKGYSRLMALDEVGTVRMLGANRNLLEKLVQGYSGRMVDTAGDGFLVEFPSVVDAVSCAVEFQREMRQRNEQLPEDKAMEFRIGINVGDVIEDGDNIFGDGVNIAARLQALADPGGIYISGTAYDHLSRKLALTYEDLGKQTVKNIIDPVRVYRVQTEAGHASSVKATKEPSNSASWKWPVIAAIVIAAIGVVMTATWFLYPRIAAVIEPNLVTFFEKKTQPAVIKPKAPDKKTLPTAVPDQRAIAVMPFRNLSGDPKQNYLGTGITVEIIHRLSAIPDLVVIAPASVFTIRRDNVSPEEIGAQLNARYLVTGGVLKNDNQLKVRARILDTGSGNIIGEKHYEDSLNNVFQIRNDLTQDILSAIGAGPRDSDSSGTSTKPPTVSWDAYERYLKGRQLIHQQKRHVNNEARTLFDEAVAIDPQFAGAYASLGETYVLEARNGWAEFPILVWRNAVHHTKKALALDAENDIALSNMAVIQLRRRMYDDARNYAQRVISLYPGKADAHALLAGVLVYSGTPTEAIKAINKAILLNPKGPPRYHVILGDAYRESKQYENAIAAYNSALLKAPKHAAALVGLIVSYQMAGKSEEARFTAVTLMKEHPHFSLTNMARRLFYKRPAEIADFMMALRQAGLQ